MNAVEVARDAKECHSLVSGVDHFRGGGNMGMMFIAQAIETHASALQALASAVQSLASGLERQGRPSNLSVDVKISPETITALAGAYKRKEEEDGK